MSGRDLGEDARYCEQVTRDHARTFSLASRLLPTDKRRAAYALYAFCRIADDLVDQADHDNVAMLSAQLDDYQRQLDAALAGEPSGAIFREVAWVSRHYAVPADPLVELLQGVRRDLAHQDYATWADLERYCEGVASSVGEMCTYVFGVPGGPDARRVAIRYARTLGVAMQLTNILRDVGEDARRGRCYLPLEDLDRFGLTSAEVLTRRDLSADPRWRPLMALEVDRARSLYAAAMPGIGLLAPDAQRCASACATGYAGILSAIEAQQYDTIRSRARLGRLARFGVLWDAWRFRPEPVDPAVVRDGPRVHGERGTPVATKELVRLA
jgi:phytoene synthase